MISDWFQKYIGALANRQYEDNHNGCGTRGGETNGPLAPLDQHVVIPRLDSSFADLPPTISNG